MRSFSCVMSVSRPFIDAVLACCCRENSEVGFENSLCAAILGKPSGRKERLTRGKGKERK